jgi:hypothetical protein
VEVLPQKWFTASQYRVGEQWITRAARDPKSHRIVGECFGVGTFLLEEDGCRLERWLENDQRVRQHHWTEDHWPERISQR